MCSLTALGSDVMVGGGLARKVSKPNVSLSPARSGSDRCTVGDKSACAMFEFSRGLAEVGAYMTMKLSR
jgi:hypothetical protein